VAALDQLSNQLALSGNMTFALSDVPFGQRQMLFEDCPIHIRQ
jgi:hypothetical protein